MNRTAIVVLVLALMAPRFSAGQESAPACVDGAIGTASPLSFNALAAEEIVALVRAAAVSLDSTTMTIAVVDRSGRPLALFRKPTADPSNDDRALGVARSAALFSHNQAPLSSRTVRAISGLHFPPAAANAPSAALYGIENTNRGCDLNVAFNEGKDVPASRSLAGGTCNPFDVSGCGSGIVTGKRHPDDPDQRAVSAGGIPLYRIIPPGLDRVGDGMLSNGRLVGAIGVVGVDGDSQLEEFASLSGAFGSLATAIAPVPAFPLPTPGNVFIDGVRLPFVGNDIRLTFNDDGLPSGARLADTSAGSADGTYVLAPRNGGCAPNEYLSGPRAGSLLSRDEVEAIVMRAVAKAKRTRAAIRLPMSSYARMVIAVGDVDGSILALYRMPDATVFSIDVAVAKARNVVYFSGDDPAVRADLPGVPAGTAITNRTIGFGSQPFFPSGINSVIFGAAPGPFYAALFLRDVERPCSQGSQAPNANQNGVVFFAGASPLFRNGALAGGLGVSGDGIEQDDYVTLAGAGSLLPPQNRWADRVKIDSVRLPMFKMPRQPEGVRECAGGPCS